MSIVALPQETARAITSTLALNDATSVIKELIDNALDAKSNSISVEISSNTIDTIQVKDNGGGIGIEDRQLLCKRGCTSKIRTLDDLACLGGNFLGFRGEALASVAELSTSVTITTRIEGEVVGTALQFGPNGKLQSSSSASHPVGTTVRIQDFLSKVPVRKQTSLKMVSKTLSNIKKLLQSYALARPRTRLALKVLKAKDDKYNWSFAPCVSDATMLEAISKAVGKHIAEQCTEHESLEELQDGQLETDRYAVHAAVISSISDLSKACNEGQFCSVDGRPVSSDRGLMKELVKMYRSYLGTATNLNRMPSKPFLHLQVRCPPNSYDVNIEPAKDELLFYNPSRLRELFKQTLVAVYGETNEEEERGSETSAPFTNTPQYDSFNVLLARRPVLNVDTPTAEHSGTPSPAPVSGEMEQLSQNSVEATSSHRHSIDTRVSQGTPIHSNMYTLDEDNGLHDADSANLSLQWDDLEEEETQTEMTRNPWTMAKMNVKVPTQMTTETRTHGRTSAPKMSVLHHGLTATPSTSSDEITPYQNPGPPVRRRAPRIGDDEMELSSPSSPDREPTNKTSSILEAWVSKQEAMQSSAEPGFRKTSNEDMDRSNRPQAMKARDGALPQLSQQRLHTQPAQLTQSTPGSPFKLPKPRQNRTSSPISEKHQSVASINDMSSEQSHVSSPSRLTLRPGGSNHAHPNTNRQELDEILEFERQKRIAIAQQRKQAINGSFTAPLPTPSPSQIGAARSPTIFRRDGGDPRPKILESNADAQDDYESRFHGRDRKDTRQAQPNNPHKNRYLAAIRHLDMPHGHPHSSSTDDGPEGRFPLEDESPRIAGSDPRAYLIRYQQTLRQQEMDRHNGLAKTGLKIKRAKTNKLPLEITPAEAIVHDLSIDMESDLMLVINHCKDFASIDEYVKLGRVDTISWSPVSRDLQGWQVEIEKIVRKKYGSYLDKNNDSDGTRTANFDFAVDLRMALKAHIDTSS